MSNSEMIYVSTGGFQGRTADDVVEELLSRGIDCVELSGGSHSATLLEDLKAFTTDVQFQIHNYFPPPENPFVLNLGSLDPEVGAQSFAHVERALQWCQILGANRYSFHAGFLIDPKVDELGRRITNRSLFDRDECIETFISRVSDIAEIARKQGVSIMIENNVLSEKNALEFTTNPFLMSEPEECQKILQQMPDNVGLLIDVAHLKVSANSIGFDPVRMFELCDKWISGYHLSDNDGLEDSNRPFTDDAWYWPYLKNDINYYTIEVYNNSPEQLSHQVDILRSKLSAV